MCVTISNKILTVTKHLNSETIQMLLMKKHLYGSDNSNQEILNFTSLNQ